MNIEHWIDDCTWADNSIFYQRGIINDLENAKKELKTMQEKPKIYIKLTNFVCGAKHIHTFKGIMESIKVALNTTINSDIVLFVECNVRYDTTYITNTVKFVPKMGYLDVTKYPTFEVIKKGGIKNMGKTFFRKLKNPEQKKFHCSLNNAVDNRKNRRYEATPLNERLLSFKINKLHTHLITLASIIGNDVEAKSKYDIAAYVNNDVRNVIKLTLNDDDFTFKQTRRFKDKVFVKTLTFEDFEGVYGKFFHYGILEGKYQEWKDLKNFKDKIKVSTTQSKSEISRIFLNTYDSCMNYAEKNDIVTDFYHAFKNIQILKIQVGDYNFRAVNVFDDKQSIILRFYGMNESSDDKLGYGSYYALLAKTTAEILNEQLNNEKKVYYVPQRKSYSADFHLVGNTAYKGFRLEIQIVPKKGDLGGTYVPYIDNLQYMYRDVDGCLFLSNSEHNKNARQCNLHRMQDFFCFKSCVLSTEFNDTGKRGEVADRYFLTNQYD